MKFKVGHTKRKSKLIDITSTNPEKKELVRLLKYKSGGDRVTSVKANEFIFQGRCFRYDQIDKSYDFLGEFCIRKEDGAVMKRETKYDIWCLQESGIRGWKDEQRIREQRRSIKETQRTI